ncbi:MAG TPA: carboxypeptidase-like regulatory domain-containing protein, partial [Candidatus Acidoferrales bacterium]
MRWVLPLLTGVLLFSGSVRQDDEDPCKCWDAELSPRLWIEKNYAVADLVFEGVPESYVVRGDAPFQERIYTVRAVRVYKGLRQEQYKLEFPVNQCYPDLRFGDHYLLYAYEFFGKFSGHGPCGRTRPIGEADADLRFLRGEAPHPDDLKRPRNDEHTVGGICGRVLRPDRKKASGATVLAWFDRKDHEPKEEGMISVILHWRPLRTVRADEHGVFRFTELPPGQYIVSASHEAKDGSGRAHGVYGDRSQDDAWSPWLEKSNIPPRVVVQAAAETCSVDLLLEQVPLHTVRGRVVFADPRPSRVAFVVLLHSQHLGEDPFSLHREANLGAQGNFEF